jgi:hypothetical protein
MRGRVDRALAEGILQSSAAGASATLGGQAGAGGAAAASGR